MYKRFIKRPIDILVSLLLLIILSPVLVVIAVCIKIDSSGGYIFVQSRVGMKQRLFPIYKFRTMVSNAGSIGPWYTSEADPRITNVGRMLRKTSLDELPQLFNVLRGDMSLVGPRPDTPYQVEQYNEKARALRHSVRPGITGLAQASGRSGLSSEERLKLDLVYAKEVNILMDLRIIWLTLATIFKNERAW